MKRLFVGFFVLLSLSSVASVPDMEAIRSALSVELFNSPVELHHRQIYREISNGLYCNRMDARDECVSLVVDSILNTRYPFSLTANDDIRRKCDCVSDRGWLFMKLIMGINELKSDRDLNLRFARRLGEIQGLQKTDGVNDYGPGGYNLAVMSFRSNVIHAFTRHHREMKRMISPNEFDAFVQEFLAESHANERERSEYFRDVFGSNYKPPKAK